MKSARKNFQKKKFEKMRNDSTSSCILSPINLSLYRQNNPAIVVQIIDYSISNNIGKLENPSGAAGPLVLSSSNGKIPHRLLNT